MIADVYTHKGDLSRAIEYGNTAVEKAPTPADKAWAEGTLAWALCRSGNPRKGVEILAPIVSMIRSGSLRMIGVLFTMTLGEGYWLVGDPERARETLEEGLDHASSCGMRYYMGWAHRLLGEVELEVNPSLSVAGSGPGPAGFSPSSQGRR